LNSYTANCVPGNINAFLLCDNIGKSKKNLYCVTRTDVNFY